MNGDSYRSYPKILCAKCPLTPVDAHCGKNLAEQFKVITTILSASIGGGQIGELYERRWDGEVDIRSIKSTMKMDILRCKTPAMVRKEIWIHLRRESRCHVGKSAAASSLRKRRVRS